MVFESFIETVCPYVISICEIMGIIVVAITAAKAFYHYLRSLFRKEQTSVKLELGSGLATALEFKMAAEILKTVLVREMSDLLVLGAIIALRGLLALLIHFEIKGENKPD